MNMRISLGLYDDDTMIISLVRFQGDGVSREADGDGLAALEDKGWSGEGS